MYDSKKRHACKKYICGENVARQTLTKTTCLGREREREQCKEIQFENIRRKIVVEMTRLNAYKEDIQHEERDKKKYNKQNT